jgi:hypothetical protein
LEADQVDGNDPAASSIGWSIWGIVAADGAAQLIPLLFRNFAEIVKLGQAEFRCTGVEDRKSEMKT